MARWSRVARQPGLGEPVAVDRGHAPAADLERHPVRVEPDADVPLPEVAAPAVVIAPDHHDRHPAPQAGQRRGHVEAAAGNDPA